MMIDVDYCAQGHECDENAKCFNLKTNYTCKCNKGFQGNGSHCTGKGMYFKFIFHNLSLNYISRC